VSIVALIECIECKKQVSNKASTCPNCGAPVKLSMDSSLYKNSINTNYEETNYIQIDKLKSGAFWVQIFIIAVIAGIIGKSWVPSVVTIILLPILLVLPVVRDFIKIILIILFGVFGYLIGIEWWDSNIGGIITGFILASLSNRMSDGSKVE